MSASRLHRDGSHFGTPVESIGLQKPEFRPLLRLSTAVAPYAERRALPPHKTRPVFNTTLRGKYKMAGERACFGVRSRPLGPLCFWAGAWSATPTCRHNSMGLLLPHVRGGLRREFAAQPFAPSHGALVRHFCRRLAVNGPQQCYACSLGVAFGRAKGGLACRGHSRDEGPSARPGRGHSLRNDWTVES